MHSRGLSANWAVAQAAVREYWQRLTHDDITSIRGERDELMQLLKARYQKTYGEIEREMTEFEHREARSAYASRPSIGIVND